MYSHKYATNTSGIVAALFTAYIIMRTLWRTVMAVLSVFTKFETEDLNNYTHD